MKKVLLSFLLLGSLIARSQCCADNYIANADFELGTPTGASDNIGLADSWMGVWDVAAGSTGEFSAWNGFPTVLNPIPAEGNFGGLWIANYVGGPRDAIMNELTNPIPYSAATYDLTFDLSSLLGDGTQEIAIYGVYDPSTTLATNPPISSHVPLNLDLYGGTDVVLLSSTLVNSTVDGTKESVTLNFTGNMTGFPLTGITHIFFTRSERTNGGKTYVGIDNLCLTKNVETCVAAISIESAEIIELETGCGTQEIPVLCEGEITIISDHCPVDQYMLSIWEWNPDDCTTGDLVYTSEPTPSPLPGSFDIWSLGFTPTNGTIYWVEWAIQQTPCDGWDFDYALFMVGDDCCNEHDSQELVASIDDFIIGYQTVESAKYGWSYDVPFLCVRDGIYDFLTNTPCSEVYTITNATFNTNLWTDITTLYNTSGPGNVPTHISLTPGQYTPNVVNHLQIAIASPYQVVDILWVPGCDPEIELDDFVIEGKRSPAQGGSNGENEMKEAGLSLFPNPTQNNFTVKLEERQSGSISISSIDGKQLLSTDFEKQIEIDMNISELPTGIYFVNINIDGELITRKVIKK